MDHQTAGALVFAAQCVLVTLGVLAVVLAIALYRGRRALRALSKDLESYLKDH